MISSRNHTLVAFLLIISIEPAPTIKPPEVTNHADLLQLIKNIKLEKNFRTLLMATNDKKICIDENVIKGINTPIVVFTEIGTCNLNKTSWNNEILMLFCLQKSIDPNHIEMFSKCIGRLHSIRTIFYWSQPYSQQESNRELLQLFKLCSKNYLQHVISIYNDFNYNQLYHAYSNFPSFHLVTIKNAEKYFPNRMSDLQGAPIRTLPDQNEPRSIVYRNASKHIQIVGYAVNVVNAYSQKHNGTLVYPLPVNPETVYFYTELQKMIRNGSLDMPMSMTSPIRLNDLHEFSMIVEQAMWFPMIPLAPTIPNKEIFLLIANSVFFLIVIVMIISFSALFTFANPHSYHKIVYYFTLYTITISLRGILGQSQNLYISRKPLIKFIYGILFVSAIFVSTTFVAYLKTYMTTPPKAKQITTFDELLRSGVKIRISANEYMTLPKYTGETFWSTYKDIFEITPNVNDFYEQRKSMDAKYGYLVSSSLRQVFLQKQTRLPHPLFHIPQSMYFTKVLYLAFPLHEYSIYRPTMNVLIRQLQESGLLDQWQRLSYDEMVMAGKIETDAIWSLSSIRSLTFLDFYWIWILYGFGLFVSSIFFIIEKIYFKRKQNYKKLRTVLVR